MRTFRTFKVSNIFKHPHGDIDKQNIGYEYVGENKDKTLVLKIYDNDQMVDGLSVFQDSLHKVSSIPLNEEILKYDSEHTHLVANDLYALLLCFVSVVNEDIHNRIPMSDEEYIKYSNMEN